MNSTSTPIIEVHQVHKSFKDVHAVQGVDLAIQKGEYVALLGPNGAGKTTLVEMIEGIQQPDAGDIKVKGLNWKQHQDQLHRVIGLSLQETRFIDKLSVRETLHLFSSFYKLPKSRVREVLELVRLKEKAKAFVVNLSGGQRQRLALGISLLNQPEVLLLDEPTTGLDPTARRELWEILAHLKTAYQTTMILTTHYMEEADYLCDRIVILDQGKVLAKGTLQKLLSENNLGEVIDFGLNAPGNHLEIPPLGDHEKILWKEDGMSAHLLVNDIVTYLPELLESVKRQGYHFTSLECRKMTLDDLFISMTGRRLGQ
ncbi:MAG: ABC transporter ATP-binding protein [Salibacteraceae bacterium]